MNLNNKTTALTEGAIITGLMVVFALIGIYFIPLTTILFPIPFVILGVRHGTKYNTLSLIAASLIIGMIVDVISGAILFITFAPLSIALAYTLKRKYSTSQIVVLSTGVTLISIIFMISFLGIISGVDFLTEIETSFNQTLKLQINAIKSMGISPYEISEMEDMLKATLEYIILIIPSIMIISSVFIAYISLWLSSSILRRLGDKRPVIPKFTRFKLPHNIILGVLIILLGTMALRYFKLLYYETIFINVIVLFSFVFFLQGLAVIIFLMNKMKLNKILRSILIALIIISVPLSFVVSIIGILDNMIDFRKLKRDV